MKYTFKGGTHVKEHKNTADCAIIQMPAPKTVSIPLSQHIGAHCTPLVSIGDYVYYGQKIGDVTNALGCPVHASVSGTVKAIDSRNNAHCVPISNIIIENDGLYTPDPSIKPYPKALEETTPDEIAELIRETGISGMGGATFPTHAKLSSAIGKVDTVIINGAECEPFITANHRLMLERPEEVIGGAEILLHALGLSVASIGIEDNKPDAIARMELASEGNDKIKICTLKTKYPQGDERQLIYALTGKELPTGKLPADLGCVIFNVETCAAVYRAFNIGTPLVKRIVTVDGDCIKEPKNLLVHIGTSYMDLIEYCGGLSKTPKKIVNGGPMMGFAQWDINGPVTKGTSAILVLSEEFGKEAPETAACIRCGRCVKNCPMRLMPNYLALHARGGDYDSAAEFNVMSCVECGTCSYNCPANVPIVQYIRVAKGALRARAAAERARAAENNTKKL